MEQKAGYSSEAELVSSFSKFLKSGGLPNNVNVVFELETGHGIADLVLYSFRTRTEIELDVFAKVPHRYAVLLSEQLTPNEFSLSSFSEYIGANENSAKRVLKYLIGLGVIQTAGKDGYRVLKFRSSPVNTIVAIEAKLRNWQQALKQAYRYKDFSHQAWVLLDDRYVLSAVRNLPQFIKTQVGLASYSAENKLSIYHIPPVSDPASNSKYWAASVRLAQAKLGLIESRSSIV